MKAGFVGVGNIGGPMAGQLLRAGHALVVHDLHPEAAAPLLAAGAAWANSPGALAADCEIVATCLPGPAEMERVALGPDGLVPSMKPGSLYIDHTTNSPLLVLLTSAQAADLFRSTSTTRRIPRCWSAVSTRRSRPGASPCSTPPSAGGEKGPRRAISW